MSKVLYLWRIFKTASKNNKNASKIALYLYSERIQKANAIVDNALQKQDSVV